MHSDPTDANIEAFYIKEFSIFTVVETQEVTGFLPDVLSYNDYYPYGMLLPKRHGADTNYRYGFQGQEKDDELKGEGNSINFKFRMHDSRLGRFFTKDPLELDFPWYSPYQFSGNRVIDRIELEGAETSLPPYLWSSTEGYTTEIIYEDSNGKKIKYPLYAQYVEGNWHMLINGKCLYAKDGKWVPNPNFITNKGFIEKYGYHYTKRELGLLEDAGFTGYEDRFHDPFSREVMTNPLPITKETIRMYGHAFGIDMEFIARLRMLGVAVEAGTMGSPNSKGANIFNKRYNFSGLVPKSIGVGPRGTIVITPYSRSVKAFLNWNSKDGGIEFIYDSKRGIFAMGNPKDSKIIGRPHQRLVQSVGSDVNGKHIVGGTVYKKNGAFNFTENSGTYGENWTPALREQFSKFMKKNAGIDVQNQGYQPMEYNKN